MSHDPLTFVPDLVSAPEAAKLCGMSRQAIHESKLPRALLSGRPVFRRSDVLAYANRRGAVIAATFTMRRDLECTS